MKPTILPFTQYLEAVERLHRVDVEDIALEAGVSVGEVRRWRRGTHAPPFPTVESLTARFGGDARLVFLGIVLERFARQVGCELEEAASMPFSKRRAGPSRQTPFIDRRQMTFIRD